MEVPKKPWSKLGWEKAMFVLQKEHQNWIDKNFTAEEHAAWMQLLGMVKGLGEFVFLIREYANSVNMDRECTNFVHMTGPYGGITPILEQMAEAICSIIFYAAGYCNEMGWLLGDLTSSFKSSERVLDAHRTKYVDSSMLLGHVGGVCHNHLMAIQEPNEAEWYTTSGRSFLKRLLEALFEVAQSNSIDLLKALQGAWEAKVESQVGEK